MALVAMRASLYTDATKIKEKQQINVITQFTHVLTAKSNIKNRKCQNGDFLVVQHVDV